jgi:Fe-S-cluster-containing dehydrogenase component/CRP-like cAMP-binding protein
VNERWPAAVWESRWLRGLDAGSRAQIEAAGRVRALAKGDRVFAAGEAADTFFVVGSGIVEVRAVRRGETEARSLRRAVAGDALGEHAVVRPGGPRVGDATCVTDAIIAEVPVAVFRRAMRRGGGANAGPEEVALQRAAARDVLRTAAVGHVLSDGDVETLVAVAVHNELGRGDTLFASGDVATHAHVVAEGMLRVDDGEEGKTRVRAYLARGDLVSDCVLDDGAVHGVTAIACGPAWVLSIPRDAWMAVARERREALEGERRWTRLGPSSSLGSALFERAAPERRLGAVEPTRHVLGDLWRFAEARSMLVIDDEACVRCGHCAWSCAEAHDDGVSRLVRRGPKVVARSAADGAERALVVPGSCQHCKHPACMLDCPTGAIGRDLRGGVFVREDICVGCGQCVRACPWGSVQMAPRSEHAKKRLPLSVSPVVAVKCDMCRGLAEGPACVGACPVDAISRIEPTAALVDVRRAVGSESRRQALPDRRPGWPWIAAGAIVSAAAVFVARSGAVASSGAARWITGAAAGALLVWLGAYAVVKRVRWPRVPFGLSAGVRRASGRSRLRPHAVAHVALGILAVGVVAAHTGGGAAPNVAGALLVAFLLAGATGAAGAFVYALVPRALSRVERTATLPEDLAARARDLDERVFGALTGRSDATKAAYARWLAPYARAPFGGLVLVGRGATLREEEKRLRACIERVVGRHAGASTLDGLEDLVRWAVERRAVRAQRVLQALLRAWVPVHVVAVAVTLTLLVVHLACVARGR